MPTLSTSSRSYTRPSGAPSPSPSATASTSWRRRHQSHCRCAGRSTASKHSSTASRPRRRHRGLEPALPPSGAQPQRRQARRIAAHAVVVTPKFGCPRSGIACSPSTRRAMHGPTSVTGCSRSAAALSTSRWTTSRSASHPTTTATSAPPTSLPRPHCCHRTRFVQPRWRPTSSRSVAACLEDDDLALAIQGRRGGR